MKRKRLDFIPPRVWNKWAKYAREWIRDGMDFEAFDKWARVEAFTDGTRFEWIAPLSSWARDSWDMWKWQVETGVR